MFAAPLSGLSAVNAGMYYGQDVRPIKPAKKVEFADKMVVPVGERNEEQAKAPAEAKTDRMQASRLEEAFNQIASSMQGQNNFYDSAMQGGSYEVVGTMFDAYA